MVSGLDTSQRASAWLANPPIDIGIAFGWFPFYTWLLTTPVVGDPTDAAFTPAFKLALLVTLSVAFVHRHFVYILFFGDGAQRAMHPRALWAAPLFVTAVVLPARLWSLPFSGAVVGAIAAWNIWHTLLQRHGIARAYAARGGGGLDARAHGRRDLFTLLALAACTAACVIVFRQDTLYGPALRVRARLDVVQEHPGIGWALLVVTGLVAAVLVVAWVRAEAQARPRVGRAPRLMFWASSLCLLGIFVVHGPVVGYLVFGFAHAVEYILFVYLFSHRRITRADTAPSARMLGRAVPLVTVSAILLALFVAARQVWTLPLFGAYYMSTSALHFFYDGLIWKMRRPEVRAPIVA